MEISRIKLPHVTKEGGVVSMCTVPSVTSLVIYFTYWEILLLYLVYWVGYRVASA